MRMKVICVIGMWSFLGLHSTATWPTDFQVGFGKKIITPPEHLLPINKGGYLGLKATGYRMDPNQPTGKEELSARSLVLEGVENGVPKIISLTYLDLVGISNRVIAKILKGVEDATGIPEDNQFVGATHTHSAPDLQGPWGGVPDEYKQVVVSGAVEAAKEAFNSRTSAHMFVSKTAGPNRNRRGWDSTDTSITFVVFKEPGINGKTLGSLLNFAAHPVVRAKDNLISRDFCGFLVDYLEDHLDTANTDDIAIFANGVVGDVLPDGDIQVGDQRSKEYGHEIAAKAITAFQANKVQINPPQLTVERIRWDLTVTGFAHNLAYILGRLDYDAYWVNGKLKIDTSLGHLRFGDQLQVVTFPGESLTRNGFQNPDGNAIKQKMTADHKLFLGLTGDSLGYFVPSAEWRSWPFSCLNNCYEEWLSPGKKAGDDARDMLIGAM